MRRQLRLGKKWMTVRRRILVKEGIDIANASKWYTTAPPSETAPMEVQTAVRANSKTTNGGRGREAGTKIISQTHDPFK